MGSYTESVPYVEVGDVDPMSVHARRMSLPACRRTRKHRVTRAAPDPCTRAAGHDETGHPHPAALHVLADLDGTVKAVWS
jgi:hypothetical protein